MEARIDWVSRFLTLLVNTVGADIVPVGGGIGAVEALTARLDTAVRAWILCPLDRATLVPAHHPADAALLGTAPPQDWKGAVGEARLGPPVFPGARRRSGALNEAKDPSCQVTSARSLCRSLTG